MRKKKVHDRTTLQHCFQYEGNHERASRTDHSVKDKLKRIVRYFKGRRRRVPNFFWVGKLGDVIHVNVDADWAGDPKTRCSTSGGALAIGLSFTVRHWSVTKATVSLSSAESEANAITKGCIQSLYVKHVLEHQIARPFTIEVWTDSSSPKVILQRRGPGRRAKHFKVQTMWVQVLNNIGLISLNNLGTLDNVAELLAKHAPRAVLDKLEGMIGHTFLMKKLRSVSIIGTRNWQQLRDCQCSTMERTICWWVMFTASRTKRLISPQPF